MRLDRISAPLERSLPIVAVMCLYLLISFLTFNQIEEDAFIYFRLAANIAEGHGFVFNFGGEPIESGSSLPWQLLLAAMWLLPLDMIVKVKLLGIAFGCLSLWLTWRISRRLITDPVLQYLPAVLLALSVPFFCWAQRGLETPFYVSAVLALCLVCCDARYRKSWYLPAFLVFCARPEGFWVLLALIPFLFVYRRTIDGLWRGVGIFIVLCATLTILRLLVFHDPVPHSFYLKGDTNLAKGLRDLYGDVSRNYVYLLLIPCMGSYFVRRTWTRQTVVVFSFLIVTATWAMLPTIDLKPYDRHFVPLLPFLFVVLVHGLSQWARGPSWSWTIRIAGVVFAIGMLTFSRATYTKSGLSVEPSLVLHAARVALKDPVAFGNTIVQIFTQPDELRTGVLPGQLPPSLNSELVMDPINTNYQATTGKFIALNYPENITIVYDQMGQTPWYAGRDKQIIDSFGLVTKAIGYYSFEDRTDKGWFLEVYDRVMARMAGVFWPNELRRVDEVHALQYVFDHDPEVIMLNTFVVDHVPDSLTAKLSRDPRFRLHYTPAYVVNHVVRIYERNDFYSGERDRVPPYAVLERLGQKSGG